MHVLSQIRIARSGGAIDADVIGRQSSSFVVVSAVTVFPHLIRGGEVIDGAASVRMPPILAAPYLAICSSMRSILLKSASALCVAASMNAVAGPVLFTGGSGGLAATVSFDLVGSQLQVVLSNTSTGDVLVPSDALTAVFFNIAGNPLLTRNSAISGGPTYLGSTNVTGAGTVVGGEWAYLNGLSQYAANSGISSSGLGVFGPGDRFPGANLSGPESPNGVEYALASAGDNPATGNAGILGEELTRSSVTFLLTTASPFDLSAIGNVTFQYGTSLSEGHFSGNTSRSVPEPGTLGLAGLALRAGAGIRRRPR
jgi:hypothetical protein